MRIPRSLLLGFFVAVAGAQDLPTLQQHQSWADYYADHHELPRAFVRSIIDVESNWQASALSHKGAAGLMQLMPATAYRFDVWNRFRADENIRAGVAYLAHLSELFEGDLRLVSAAYYAGEHRVARRGLMCSDAAILRYVASVARRYRAQLKVLEGGPSR